MHPRFLLAILTTFPTSLRHLRRNRHAGNHHLSDRADVHHVSNDLHPRSVEQDVLALCFRSKPAGC